MRIEIRPEPGQRVAKRRHARFRRHAGAGQDRDERLRGEPRCDRLNLRFALDGVASSVDGCRTRRCCESACYIVAIRTLPSAAPCQATRSARSFCVTSFGESHGPAIGCVVDGCPPGIALAEADIQRDLDRRRPGHLAPRHAAARAGHGRDPLRRVRRPHDRHADRAPDPQRRRAQQGLREHRRHLPSRPRRLHVLAEVRHPRLSRRRAAVGARDRRARGRGRDREEVAARALRRAHPRPPDADRTARRSRSRTWRTSTPTRSSPPTRRSSRSSKPSWTRCASPAIRSARASRSIASGVPVGWGEPVYGKLDADLASAMMGINAVKGVEIGAGFAAVAQRGTEHSDEMTPQGFLSQPRRRHPGRHLDGPGHRRRDRGQADVVDPPRPPLDRQGGQSGHRQHARPPRSVRGHSRDADRRSDDGAGADGPRAAPSRAERRRRTCDAAASRRRRRRRGREAHAARRRPPTSVDDPDPDEACRVRRLSLTCSSATPRRVRRRSRANVERDAMRRPRRAARRR